MQPGDLLPPLEAENLAKEAVQWPRALEGRDAIAMFSFSKEGGKAVAGWTKAIKERLTDGEAPDIWQVMVLEDVPRLIRGFVLAGIRKGIPEAMHARSLALYEDAASWRSRCAIPSDDVPCVMLIDGEGEILWIRAATMTDVLLDDLLDRAATE